MALGIGLGLPFAGSSGPVTHAAFASLLSGAYQVFQTDLGITYQTAMLQGGGATDTVTLTDNRSGSTVAKPILAKGTGTGTVSLYTDGGTTPVASGVTPSPGTPVVVPGASVSLTWTSATIANGHTWTACASALADQSGNAKNASQGVATKCPALGPGLNGKPELMYDGVDDFFTTGFTGVAGMTLVAVVKQNAWTGYATMFGGGTVTNSQVLFQDGFSVTPNIAAYNGTELNGNGLTLGSWGLIIATWNGASSSIKVGSNSAVNGNAGAGAVNGSRGIGCDRNQSTPVNFCKFSLLAAAYVPNGTDLTAFVASLNKSSGYGTSSVLT